ncbi:universal stress protein [Reyranella sp.]|uniref:universal stress protein n=1 Tax=Reyranella sp. TaxID=1929291 RepID=UPI0027302CB7|nr:universal stress protein [Reyranella sp.]MDP2377901.1 universal stress protein [Reyranella sp.]
MYKKALVGVDVSPAEEAFLSCLPDLKSWGTQSVVLAHVIQIGRVQGAGYGHEDEYRSWLDERAAPLREAGLTVTTSVTASGAPADELLEVAQAERADLVVVGSRSHNFLYEIFLGSVAKEVVRKSKLPVLVLRLELQQVGQVETSEGNFSQPPKSILLATDLSAQSRPAEDAAVHLAAQSGRIDCLTVLADDAPVDARRAVEAHHQELAQRIKKAGGNAGSRIEQGEPSASILRVSEEGYSLVVIGKHGRNWIEGKVMGSTAAKVCEDGRRPILIVPLRQD